MENLGIPHKLNGSLRFVLAFKAGLLLTDSLYDTKETVQHENWENILHSWLWTVQLKLQSQI